MKILLRVRICRPHLESSVLGSSTCCQTRLRSSSLRVPALAYICGLSQRIFMNHPG